MTLIHFILDVDVQVMNSTSKQYVLSVYYILTQINLKNRKKRKKNYIKKYFLSVIICIPKIYLEIQRSRVSV